MEAARTSDRRAGRPCECKNNMYEVFPTGCARRQAIISANTNIVSVPALMWASLEHLIPVSKWNYPAIQWRPTLKQIPINNLTQQPSSLRPTRTQAPTLPLAMWHDKHNRTSRTDGRKVGVRAIVSNNCYLDIRNPSAASRSYANAFGFPGTKVPSGTS